MRHTSRITYRPTQRGSVFLLAIVILVVILTLGASLIERAQTGVYRASVEGRATRAFHLAEAGVHKAVWELNQPNGWLTYAGESGVQIPGGFVDVSITPVPADRGVYTTHATIIATGYLPGAGGAMRYPSTIRAIAYKEPRYFDYALFGDQSVTVGNGTVTLTADSYTSDDGSYGGTNITANADIGTNSTAADAVKILPQGEVHGDVSVGAGASDPNACVDNKGIITGTVSALPSTNALPSVTVPSDAIELGDVYLDLGQELVLDPGVYHMTDLDIFGNAKVTCNGKVVIYIDQTADQATPDVRIGGNGIVNTSQIPANLVVYCCPDVVTVQFSGNAQFYGGLYAPQADIALNAGDVYGSMVGNSVTLNGTNAHIHYDEALRDHSNPNALMRSWEVF
jgi:choice-of-anchor A domain-containing protein